MTRAAVSIWDQASADKMIPILLETNLATRIVSLEPCLGAADIFPYLSRPAYFPDIDPGQEGVDGVILGGESGPGARPMELDWARNVRDQCQAAWVPFYFKQWGECCSPLQLALEAYKGWLKKGPLWNDISLDVPAKVGKKAAGRILDGRTWDYLPEGFNVH